MAGTSGQVTALCAPGTSTTISSSGGTFGPDIDDAPTGDTTYTVSCNTDGTVNVSYNDPVNLGSVVQTGVTGLTITCT